MIRSLRAKVMLGFTVVVLLVTFIAAWTVVSIDEVGEQLLSIGSVDFVNAESADQMRLELSLYNLAVIRYITDQNDSARAQASTHQAAFYRWLDRLSHNQRDSSEAAFIREVGAMFSGLNATFTGLVATVASGERSGGQGVEQGMIDYGRSFVPTYEVLLMRLQKHVSILHEQSAVRIAEIRSAARFVAYSTFIIAVAVLAISVIASQKVLQTILRPINDLTLSAQRVAEGDFLHEIVAYDASDELSELVRHFNRMIQQLREYDAMKLNQIVAEKRRCETIVRDLSDVIVATDQNGTLIYFNREAESIFDLPARLALGATLSELAGEREFIGQLQRDVDAGSLDGAERIVQIELRGEPKTFSYEAQTIRDGESDILGYVFRLKDITRFKRLDEIKTKMVSTVSHELRTPLTSMGMSLELLLEEEESIRFDAVQHQLLENMQEDVRRLQGFVNDLLDLSRIESGKVRLRLRAIEPRRLADDAARRIAPVAGRQEIRIDTTGILMELPPVHADEDRIAQVFSNLYSNALRYTPFQGTIMVGAEALDGVVRFCVRDNGPGISQPEAAHIFEKFYQIRDDQRAGGSGLGLAIVKEIVEAHGGDVWVESAVGRGSSFYFTLPRSPQSEQ